MLGSLTGVPALTRPDLLAEPVLAALQRCEPADAALVGVAEIDPELADTAGFCDAYGSPVEGSANCVVVAGRRRPAHGPENQQRGGETGYVACLVLASARADVNGVVRRWMNVRKASFAATDEAVARSGMEYGGITPIGLPADWPVLVDAAVVAAPEVVVGSGVRRSKLALPGELVARLPGAQVVEGLAR